MKRGKKYRAIEANLDKSKVYEIDEAIALAQKHSYARFDETVEVAIKLKVRKSDSIRDTLVLPNQFAAEKRIVVFARGDKAGEAKDAGAYMVGAEELVEKIKGGWLDFDVCVATPDMMKDVGRLGPVLGRRGMMPNPKTRTVTMDIAGVVGEFRQGRVEFRADSGGVVHIPVGKLSMDKVAIRENVDTIVRAVRKKRPADLKGDFIKSANLSSSMGPGLKFQLGDAK